MYTYVHTNIKCYIIVIKDMHKLSVGRYVYLQYQINAKKGSGSNKLTGNYLGTFNNKLGKSRYCLSTYYI